MEEVTRPEWYHCFNCRRVYPIVGEMPLTYAKGNKCISCSGVNGEIISDERANAGFEAGVFYDVDPRNW